MLRKKNLEPKIFYNFDLESFVPADHFLRKVKEYISFEFIREKVKHLYSHTGQPAIDPVVLIKMLLIGYFYDIKSERKLEKEIQVNLAYRWFVGYDIDEKIPDHSVISQTRRRKFIDSGIFQDIFDEIVKKLIDKGLVDGNIIMSDSTEIKANASLKSFVPTKEYLESLDKNSKEDDHISNKTHCSNTDPDSKLMSRPGKPSGPHYLEHRSIDKSGLITDVFVTPGNASDHVTYIDRIIRQKDIFGFDIKKCVADKGYGNHKIYQDLTDMRIEAYIPLRGSTEKKKLEYTTSDFEYDSKKDIYICPEGKILTRYKNSRGTWKTYIYAASTKSCKLCPARKKCTNNKTGKPKLLYVSIYQKAVDYQLSKENTKEWKELLTIRKYLMEGSFADAKANHGLRWAKMRGLKKVLEQSLMTAVAQNIKKMLSIINKKKKESFRVSIFLFNNLIKMLISDSHYDNIICIVKTTN